MALGIPLLIVDDIPRNRLALRAMLDHNEYAITEASDGREALKALLDHDYAAILLDVRMPGMDGFEVAQLVRQRDRTRELPILFLTAEAPEAESELRGYRLGAVDYLIKPLVPDIVRAKVAVFADLYRARKRAEAHGRALLEIKEREAEVRLLRERLEGERRYRRLAESVPNIVWSAARDGSITYFNPRWFEYTGATKEREAKSWLEFVHPEDLDRVRSLWQESVRTNSPCEFELRLRNEDGGYRWFLGRALPEDGSQSKSWLGTLTDIEHQKRAQEILAEFKGTLDAVVDAVFIFDPLSWRLQYLNHGAQALMGLSEDQLRQMRTLDLLPEYSEQEFRELLRDLARNTRSVSLETHVKGPRAEVPVELSLQHIHINGGRLVGIGRDISDRKRAEKERERLYQGALDAIRARDEFLSIASHELKTPLAALRLHLESIRRRLIQSTSVRGVPEPLEQRVEVANRQITRLAILIEQLLDVSRIRTGRFRIEPEENVDLTRIVQEVLASLEPELKRAGCTISLDAPSPVKGRWDRTRLEQVVTNLISNAIKFAPGKPIELSLHQEGPSAKLSVTDHGIGIPPALQERIFGRFERAVSARNYGGLGLGLYIVRKVLDAHGGKVRVDSSGRPGEGATFTIELPKEPPASFVFLPEEDLGEHESATALQEAQALH